jgi:glycosyltransferase involved in cell wall biosynthesis
MTTMRILHPTDYSKHRKGSAVIVVPCFNEEIRLQTGAFVQFAIAHPHIRFVLVNDGSVDGTLRILTEIGECYPDSFEIVSFENNQGKAAATRVGIQRALQMDSEYVGYWDADLATPLDAIPLFCSILNRYPRMQAVIGSRLSLLGRQISRDPLRARLGRVFSLAASAALGFRIRDTQCGAKLFRANDALSVALETPFSTGWIFDVELLRRLNVIEGDEFPKQIYEFPLDVWDEIAGSKLKPKHFFQAAAELLSLVRLYRGKRRRKYHEFAKARLSEMTQHRRIGEPELESLQSKAA